MVQDTLYGKLLALCLSCLLSFLCLEEWEVWGFVGLVSLWLLCLGLGGLSGGREGFAASSFFSSPSAISLFLLGIA